MAKSARVATFDSNGVPIHYEVFGQGKAIILVHGWGSSLKGNWVDTGWIEALTPIRQVVALDCRGHGLSGKPHGVEAYRGHAMVDDIVRLMEHLRIDRADLFGYSMGAAISLRLLVSHPDRFETVILGGIGNVLMLRTEGRPNVVSALLTDDPSTITDPVAKGFRLFAEANKNDLKALAAYEQAPRLPLDSAALAQISVPVLIVNGATDVLVGSPDEIAAAIPGARLVKIPDRDHLTVVPDPRFKEAVVHFLKSDGQ
jgi:pimeloyl-ACP methyl ester carboxylesterase